MTPPPRAGASRHATRNTVKKHAGLILYYLIYAFVYAGMDWYTTKHSLINYVTYYRDWQPDVVVVMHAINDLC